MPPFDSAAGLCAQREARSSSQNDVNKTCRKVYLHPRDFVVKRNVKESKRVGRWARWLTETSITQKENAMNNQVRPYEPLTSENAALVLVDHQVGLMSGVRDISTGELKHNVVGLAKAAKLHKLPVIVTTTARDSMWGPTFPELVEALPGIEIIDRATVNAFDDARVSRAIETTGRKKLIFAGISLEICAAFPAVTAVGGGLGAVG